MKRLHIKRKKTVLPNGHRIEIELVDHPGAVVIIPFLSRDKIILLRQFRPVIKKYLYELPARTKERSESALRCARREIIEETGYAPRRLTRLGFIYSVPGLLDREDHALQSPGVEKRRKPS